MRHAMNAPARRLVHAAIRRFSVFPVHRIVASTYADHHRERDRGEQQLDDHVRRQDGVRPQGRRPQSFEDAALTVDSDDGNQGQDGARGDQQGREDRQIDRDEALCVGRGPSHSWPEHTARHHEDQHRKTHRTDQAQRFTHEDLDFEPGQSPESAQHNVGRLNSWTNHESCGWST